MSEVRIKFHLTGNGVLGDGTRYSRELNVSKSVISDVRNTEESTDEITIGTGSVKVVASRENGNVSSENVIEDGIDDRDGFENVWHEVNWRWSRVLGFHVPSNSQKI